MNERNHWIVGDRLHGAGNPDPNKPYVLPTADQHGRIVHMTITNIEHDGPRYYWGTVASIDSPEGYAS